MVTVESRNDVKAFQDFSLSAAAAPPTAPTVAVPKKEPSSSPSPPQPVAVAPSLSPGGRIFASPLARTLAREASLDLSVLPSQGYASGPNGRIIADDVRAAIASGVKAQPSQIASSLPQPVPTPSPQQPPLPPPTMPSGSIHDLFTHAKRTVPHYFLSIEVNLSKIQSLRKQLGSEGESLSVQDFLIKAAARAMSKVPEVNAAWMDSFVRKYDQVAENFENLLTSLAGGYKFSCWRGSKT